MHEDIYRQNASVEVDAAWIALGVDCESVNHRVEQRDEEITADLSVLQYPRSSWHHTIRPS